MATGIIRPNSNILRGWLYHNDPLLDYACVDEEVIFPNDGDTTDYVYQLKMTWLSDGYEEFGMTSLNQVSSVSSIKIYIYASMYGYEELTLNFQLYSNGELLGADNVLINSGEWLWYMMYITGLNLTQNQLDNLSIRFNSEEMTGHFLNEIDIATLYAEVNYTESSNYRRRIILTNG